MSCERLMVRCVGISGFPWFSWVCGSWFVGVARGSFGVDMSLAGENDNTFQSASNGTYHLSGGISLSWSLDIEVA